MSDESSFRDLIRRVRAGDSEAATELVRRYEPAIRVAVRTRLKSPRLRRLLDSMDVAQSVLASFFVRMGAGQYEVDRPEQLLNLLAAMARNKLLVQAKKLRAIRRGGHLHQHDTPEGWDTLDPGPSPSQVVALGELLEKVRGYLSAETWQVAQQRAQGCHWAEIAAAAGVEPDALRMRFNREVSQVLRRLGLEE